MVQRDYGYAQPLGIPGGIFDLGCKQVVTRTLDAGMKAKPGMGLVVGASAGVTVSVPAENTEAGEFEGVFVHGSKQMEHTMDGEVAANGFDTVGLMQRGRIWALVASTATISYGKKAALILTGDNAGKFTDSDDADEEAKVTIDAVFTGKADLEHGIAVLEL